MEPGGEPLGVAALGSGQVGFDEEKHLGAPPEEVNLGLLAHAVEGAGDDGDEDG